MNRGKIFVSFRNIKNILKNKILFRGTNNTSTDLADSHTYAIGGMHLIGVMVLVAGGELLQFFGDVISSTGIGVPICIYTVGGRSS